MLSSLSTMLIDHRGPVVLAPVVDGSEVEVARAITPALARVIDGLAAMADGVGPGVADDGVGPGVAVDGVGPGVAADGVGPLAVADLVDRHDAPLVEELVDYLHETPTRPGHDILDRVFGAERGLVVIGLASALGLAPSLVGRLLPLVAPLVTAEMARRRDAAGLDEAGLVAILDDERSLIVKEGLLDGTAFDEAGLADPVEGHSVERGPEPTEVGAHPSTMAGATRKMAGATREREVEGADPSASVATLGRDQATTGRGRGVGDPMGPSDHGEERPVDDEDGTDDLTEDHGPKGHVFGAADVVADVAVDDVPLPVLSRSIDVRVTAVTWLGWAAGAVVLVLLLASLLSTCSDATTPMTEDDLVIAVDGGDSSRAMVESEPAAPARLDRAVGGAGLGLAVGGPGSTPPTGVSGTVPVRSTDPVASSEPGSISIPVSTSIPGSTSVPVSASNPGSTSVPATLGDGERAGYAGITVRPGESLNDRLGLGRITFASASAELTAEGRAVVDEVARYLLTDTATMIEIGGYTDDDGDPAENLELSQERADQILERLAAAGVARDRMIAVGYGETEPKAPNDSPDNKALNRRIELTAR